MNGKSLLISIVAVIISFAGGFLLANALNRSELNSLKAENGRLQQQSPAAPENASGVNGRDELSDEELRQRIAEADRNPTNFGFQKSLGIALYRYAAMKKDEALLGDAEKILRRAHGLDAKDYDVTTALGHLNFDLGLFKKDNQKYEIAREFYLKALAQKPDDTDVRTDYGITFYLQNPPEIDKAINEFNKTLKKNPKHEKTLQFLAQALLKQGKTGEAETILAKLKEINPNTPTLAELQAQNP